MEEICVIYILLVELNLSLERCKHNCKLKNILSCNYKPNQPVLCLNTFKLHYVIWEVEKRMLFKYTVINHAF